MKVKCIRILNSDGHEVESSPWLTHGRVYHVMSTHVSRDGKRSYGIINSHPKDEWPQMGRHQAECFEVVSKIIPSNWREWEGEGGSGMSPTAWQVPGFYETFYDHDPEAYPIFERERDTILREDP
jgi:hypothetical protein